MSEERQKRRSIAEARRNLPSLVRDAEEGEAVELTRRGKPVAVLLSSREYSLLSHGSRDLWSNLQSFRRRAALDELDVDAVYRDARDRSPGRGVDL